MQATLPPATALPASGLLGTPTGELVLQICGGEHDGRVLRLNSAKCLIGAAPGCTLRLRARGVRPVHALILRGPAGALVRCWSPDAQLNGQSFTEEALRPGDKLQIGPVSLVVVEISDSVPAESSAFRLPPPEQPEERLQRTRCRVRSRERRRKLFAQLRRDREEQTTLQETVAAQQQQLAALEQQIQQLQHEAVQKAALPMPAASSVSDPLNQQLMMTIQQLQQELESSAKRHAIALQAATRQRPVSDEEIEQRLQQKLSEARQQLQAQHEESLAELSAQHSRQLAALEHQLQASRCELESVQAELAAKTRNEEQIRGALAAQLEQVNQSFALIRQERDELFEQLHAARCSSTSLAEVEEIRRNAQAQIAEIQAAAQKQVFQLREEFAARERQWDEELLARTKAEAERRAEDAERMMKLTAEYETLRAEAAAAAAASRQQQEGFTQARKRLEAEIAALNARLQQQEQALYEARQNSGQVQAQVLADAEQARAQRDAVREQMLRQQQDWTEFRSRLEAAAAAERELAQARFAALEAELAARNETVEQLQTECAALEQQLEKLKVELEQSQEALFAAESGVNQRLQQMTVSMDQMQVDRGEVDAQLEKERAEWEEERNNLAQCVADLQRELTQLTARLQSYEGHAQQATEEAAAQAESSQQQWQAAQEQLAQWQTAAEQAKQQAEELSQAVARFQEQEQAWQREREQFEQLQQESTSRLQQLEGEITELRQQLDEAQRAAAAATCPQIPRRAPVLAEDNLSCTINVANQELAALQEQRIERSRPAADISSTINVAHQDLAALQEQMSGPVPSLLAPRGLDPDQLAAFQAREAALQEQADQLAAQQAQLEEEQALVARQRIELEQFQASLMELERSLTERAEALMQQSAIQQASNPSASPEQPAQEDLYSDSYYGEPDERESSPLSESEAFRAMADQVANLYRTPVPAAAESSSSESPAADATPEQPSTSDVAPEIDERTVDESGEESLIISTPAQGEREYLSPADDGKDQAPSAHESDQYGSSAVIEPTILGPEGDDDFERQLDARIARVMRQDNASWSESAGAEQDSEGSEHVGGNAWGEPVVPPPTQSQAVNSVLDRLREAGLWKGEGTAKADQLPSSSPPVEEGNPYCRSYLSEPVGHDEPAEEQASPTSSQHDESDQLSLLAQPRSASSSLLQPPADDESEAEDSIESYMSRLLARLKTSEPEEPRKTNSRTDDRNPRLTSTTDDAAPPPAPTEAKPLKCLTELAPRSQAPELNANLAAMRELANSAARNAIETHQQKRGKQRISLSTISTVMALFICFGFVFYWWRVGSWLAIGGAILSVLWASVSSLTAAQNAMKLRKPVAENVPEKEEAETPTDP